MRMLLVVLLIVLMGCSGQSPKERKPTTVSFSFIPYYTGKIFLEKLSFTGERPQVLDSAELDMQTDHLKFRIPAGEESVYQFRIRNVQNRVYFINDVEDLQIKAKSADLKDYEFPGSPANTSLRTFLNRQKQLASEIEALQTRKKEKRFDSPGLSVQQLAEQIRARDLAYADTTKSPGAFLFVYSRLDFGKDFMAMKAFVDKAVSRFPAHKAISEVDADTERLVRIFGEEYDIGEVLPDLQLPDATGKLYPLSGLRGYYLFIHFWSTWCPQCLGYLGLKEQLARAFPSGNIEVVGIALDSKVEEWQKMVNSMKYPGIQLIDEKMWRGTAAETFKIDSIPFNFLVSPEGRVLAKALKRDSVLPWISRLVTKPE